jgi:hypothetical protein
MCRLFIGSIVLKLVSFPSRRLLVTCLLLIFLVQVASRFTCSMLEGHVMAFDTTSCIWIWIKYIYVVRFEFELFIFFAEKSTVGAVLDWTALTNTHSRGGWGYNRPYRSPLQGRLKTPAAPTEGAVGAAENTSRPYRGHCRSGQETAPTEAPSVGTPWEGRLAQPPLQRL